MTKKGINERSEGGCSKSRTPSSDKGTDKATEIHFSCVHENDVRRRLASRAVIGL